MLYLFLPIMLTWVSLMSGVILFMKILCNLSENELRNFSNSRLKEYLDDIEFQYRDNINELNFQKRNDPRTESDCFLDEKAQTMFGTEGVVNLKTSY